MNQTHIISRRHLLATGAAGALSTLGLPSFAADAEWPGKIVKMVVAFPAGGPTDTAARITSQKLGERLGTSIMVDNRPGASGSIGTAQFIKSPADGNTLSMFGMPALLAPLLYKNGAYDVEKDFMCVATVYDLPMAIVVNPTLMPGVDSLQSLIAHAKAAKTPLNYTSSGAGSFGHLAMEQLKDLGGFDMQHVPYRGSAPAVTDLIGGQVPAMFSDLVGVLPHIKAGKLRAIAVGSGQRVSLLPDVKTVAEQGFPGFDATSWGGLLAPAGTPKDIVERMSAELKKALADKEVQEKLQSVGTFAAYRTPEQTGVRMREDFERWGKVIRDNHITNQ